jgi:hypothetical protein
MKTNKIFFLTMGIVLLSSQMNGQITSHRNNIVTVSDPANNCGYGKNALNNTGTGIDNTAVGYKALQLNASGNNNTAVGVKALTNNDDGSDNTAIGAESLYNNCSGGVIGDKNTALGHSSLHNNTDGDENTATGKSALYSNTAGSHNTALGSGALFSNSGVAGNYGEDNSAAGYQSLYNNTLGVRNVALGSQALYNGQNYNHNTAVGFKSNYNVLGHDNTTIGHSAMYSGGENNTAAGYKALYNNSSFDNTAYGHKALYNNQALGNVAIGSGASSIASAGGRNTACGYNALKNNNGAYNIGLGCFAGQNFANGTIYNTAVGYQSLQYINPGSYNTLVGALTDMTGNFSNSSAIGISAMITGNNMIRLGAITTSVGGNSAYTTSSDGRFKYNIDADEVKGLDFIMRLRPVAYNFDFNKYEAFIFQNQNDSMRKKLFEEDLTRLDQVRYSGFIAQEVEKAAKESNFDFNGIYKPADENDSYKLSYDAFVVPLVKAIQEQQKILEQQKVRTQDLKNKLTNQNNIISGISDGIFNALLISLVEKTDPGIDFSIRQSVTDNKLVVNYFLPTKSLAYSLLVYDSNGNQISEYKIPSLVKEGVISTESLEPGHYILTMLQDGKCVGIQNFNSK